MLAETGERETLSLSLYTTDTADIREQSLLALHGEGGHFDCGDGWVAQVFRCY